MYQPRAIQTSFQKLVGFLPPNDPNTPVITGDLLLSETGIFVSNVHPLCTLDYLFLACPDFSLSKYSQWMSGSDYAAGAPVKYNNLTFKAVAAIIDSIEDPITAGVLVWAPYLPWQGYVQQLYNQASSNVIAAVVQRKKLTHMGKAILERQQLYRGLGVSNNLIVNMGNFVGFIIEPASAEGLLVIINKAGIQSSEAQSEITYYLYHTSRQEPLQIFHVPIDSPDTFDWKDLKDINGLPCIIGYMGLDGTTEVDSNGFFLFGYHQQDLQGQAVNKSWDCSTICSTCDQANLNMYNKWSRHTRLRNVLIPGNCFDGDNNLIQTNTMSFGNTTNWGMNLSITVRCDLTKTITDNRFLWGQSLSKSLAYEILKVIAFSPRIGPLEGGIKQEAMADLDSQIPSAFINDFNNEVNCLNMDLSGFSSACMPEDDTDRIEWDPGV